MSQLASLILAQLKSKPQTARDLVRFLKEPKKSEVNSTLYALLKEGKVAKDASPTPVWSVPDTVANQDAQQAVKAEEVTTVFIETDGGDVFRSPTAWSKYNGVALHFFSRSTQLELTIFKMVEIVILMTQSDTAGRIILAYASKQDDPSSRLLNGIVKNITTSYGVKTNLVYGVDELFSLLE